MKRLLLTTMAALLLTGAFAAAQEISMPENPQEIGITAKTAEPGPEYGTQVSDMDLLSAPGGVPLWSSDGTIITVTDANGDVQNIPLEGGAPDMLYESPNEHPNLSPELCCYTPDGSEILFTLPEMDEESGLLYHLYAVDVETRNVRPVMEDCIYAVYSPDGQYLAYANMAYPEDIIVREVATGYEMFLPSISHGQRFAWSPDGAAILMHTGVNEFQRVPIDGSDPEVYEFETAWMFTADPQRPFIVLFKSDGLYRVNYETAESTRITPAMEYEFRNPSLSPDGTKLAYLVIWEEVSGNQHPRLFYMDLAEKGLIPTTVEEAPPTAELVIGNYPNPFNPSTTIMLSLPDEGFASLDIYNLSGQKVRELVNANMAKGVHTISWDGRNAGGTPVASGIYIARIVMGNQVATRRMTLMK